LCRSLKHLQDFCHTLILALDIIETTHSPGVIITTSAVAKFYSNGLDLNHVQQTPHFFTDSLWRLFYRFITYPMPTVALVNGHAFAGGLMLAMMHDYRIMNPHRGFVCLIGLELGYSLRPPMLSVFREKVSPTTLRRMILEAVRFKVSSTYYV
jgi:Delta3-Delta2-enoyl-CoA isomerase